MSTLKWEHFRVKSKPVGRGKQGKVFKGFDPMNHRKVAIKRMKNIEEARQEGFVMQKYGTHPHLPKLYDFFILDGKAYLVMEWVPGDSLKNKPKKYSEKTAVQITLNLLNGLKKVHDKGFLHTDILPNNVMINKKRPHTVKLIDFGITVKKNNHIYQGKHYRKKDSIFCPPEQRLSEWWVLDDSSDLYRIAGICIYLLTKNKPKLNRKTRAHRCKLKNKRLAKVLNKAMHPNRESRYSHAAEMMKALAPFSS